MSQAGIRYSIDHLDECIESNIIGFYNIIELCRHYRVEHLVYASSSFVYSGNIKIPFSTDVKVDSPISLYAATKKSDELLAHVYSKLYNIPSTGLRFFTVYGPAGRPDMAYYSFTNKLVAGENVKIFNMDLVRILAEELINVSILPKQYDINSHMELVPMQPCDVPITYSDIDDFEKDFGFAPQTSLREGLHAFAIWYKDYYKI